MGATGTEWSAQSLTGAGGSGVSYPTFWSQPSAAVPAGQEPFPTDQQAFAAGVAQQPFGQGPAMSMLPVPYQDASAGAAAGTTQSLILLPPGQTLQTGALLPALQQSQVPGPPIAGIPTEEEALYIPPMYTRPRPIIPRYRAISGLISFVLVMLLLCGGAAYYARASGKFAFVGQLFGVAPPNLPATPPAHLPDPKASENGPAYGIISSATTAPSVDPKTGIALQPGQVFKPGQTIYLTYSVHAKKAGTVTVKWYTNGLLYQVLSKSTPDGKGGSWTGVSMMRFLQPLEGMIELYWSDGTAGQPQLAIRLYFVVR
jgi:hypothetical protein